MFNRVFNPSKILFLNRLCFWGSGFDYVQSLPAESAGYPYKEISYDDFGNPLEILSPINSDVVDAEPPVTEPVQFADSPAVMLTAEDGVSMVAASELPEVPEVPQSFKE